MTPAEIAAEVDDLAGRLRTHGYYCNAIGTLTDTSGAGAVLGVSTRQLERWREEGREPQCFHTTRWVYPIRGLLAYLQANASTTQPDISTSQRDPREGRSGST